MILFRIFILNISSAGVELTTMNYFQIASWIVAIIVAIITATITINNYRHSLQIRESELRWKQASAARDILKDIHDHKKAKIAVLMMDWNVCYNLHPYDDDTKIEFNVMYSEVIDILPQAADYDTGNEVAKDFSRKDKIYYILDCFDWFFYYVDRVEQNIRSGLILFENVKYVFLPYYLKISKDRIVFEKFITDRGYQWAHEFWKRYEQN